MAEFEIARQGLIGGTHHKLNLHQILLYVISEIFDRFSSLFSYLFFSFEMMCRSRVCIGFVCIEMLL